MIDSPVNSEEPSEPPNLKLEYAVQRNERIGLGVLGQNQPQSSQLWKIILAVTLVSLVGCFIYWYSRTH